MAAGARADVAGLLGQARAEARAAERLEGQAQDQAATSNLPVAALGVALGEEEGDRPLLVAAVLMARLGQRAAMAAL